MSTIAAESAPTGKAYLRVLFDAVSNWGRWGAEDQLGTLNLIGRDQRLRGARTVTEGRTVSMAHRLEALPRSETVESSERGITARLDLHNHGGGVPNSGFGFTDDQLDIAVHGANQTHLDALCHIFFDGKMYNGRTKDDVLPRGSLSNDITQMAGGIVTRGVLLDIPRLRGGYVRPDEPVRLTELLEAEHLSGATVQPGDALMIRVGRELRWAAEGGPACEEIPGGLAMQGMHPEVLTWLHEKDIAILGSDSGSDVAPARYGCDYPVHVGSLVFMGCPLIDNADFEDLAAVCTELGRAEFQFAVAPIPVSGATGSLINPLATF
jgi:kynurenine formamidase